MRIKRLFHSPHDRQGLAMLGRHIAPLTDPDAVFAGAGPLHLYGALDHSFIDSPRRLAFSRLFGIDQKNNVEIAIPDMTDDGRKQPDSSISDLVSAIQSASLDMGTQTSVDQATAPGRRASAA